MEQKNCLYFIGGITKQDNDSVQEKEDKCIWVFSTLNQKWEKVMTSGRYPIKKRNQMSFEKNGFIYIYGGRTPQGKYSSDINILNIETMVWKRFFQLMQPPARINAIFTHFEEDIYLIGGSNSNDNFNLNEVWNFNTG